MRGFAKKAMAFLAAGLMLTAGGCGGEKATGNLGDVTIEAGDVYAIISIMDYGDITAKLFPEAAPKSVQRFTEFSERGYYDYKTIHRVIDNYAIQGGSLNGDGSDGKIPDAQYVPLEISDSARNFYGALCFASNSKGSYGQFYIVDNNTPQDIDKIIETISGQLADEEIASRLTEKDKKYYEDYLKKLNGIPKEVREKYASVGGLYQLDGQSTVFGQVIDGFDVLEKISSVEVVKGNVVDDTMGTASKPIENIIIEKITIVRMEPEVTEETTKKKSKTTKATAPPDTVVAETLPTTAAETEISGEESSEDTLTPVSE